MKVFFVGGADERIYVYIYIFIDIFIGVYIYINSAWNFVRIPLKLKRYPITSHICSRR